MTAEQRERYKKAEAAEQQKQHEIRARHETDMLYGQHPSTDPYESTPAEPVVDALAKKPSLGIMSALLRCGLFIALACALVAYRSGKPGRVASVAGLDLPLHLKVAGDYQHLLGGGRDSPGVVALYLHHDASRAADWHSLAPFADDAPAAADADFFLRLAAARISKTLLFVCDGAAPGAALREAATRGGASAAFAAALRDTLAVAAPTPARGARLFVTCHEGATLLLYQAAPAVDGKVARVPEGGSTVGEEMACDALLQALLGPQAEQENQAAALERRQSIAEGFGKTFHSRKRYPVHSEL
eukprot:CAMPEP_0119093224 /NCGR_PEP_ID=MMETSP1178-20130426/162407_1 /TAXON_ID=33656 /ORGANISM="unid sp, Strain CCMP2000" /LENGTH=300 /DNA_ID=CAMNT_0007076867 /DNA_START=34 /DNA_END=936 /DNA_ORIENTATION=+